MPMPSDFRSLEQRMPMPLPKKTTMMIDERKELRHHHKRKMKSSLANYPPSGESGGERLGLRGGGGGRALDSRKWRAHSEDDRELHENKSEKNVVREFEIRHDESNTMGRSDYTKFIERDNYDDMLISEVNVRHEVHSNEDSNTYPPDEASVMSTISGLIKRIHVASNLFSGSNSDRRDSSNNDLNNNFSQSEEKKKGTAGRHIERSDESLSHPLKLKPLSSEKKTPNVNNNVIVDGIDDYWKNVSNSVEKSVLDAGGSSLDVKIARRAITKVTSKKKEKRLDSDTFTSMVATEVVEEMLKLGCSLPYAKAASVAILEMQDSSTSNSSKLVGLMFTSDDGNDVTKNNSMERDQETSAESEITMDSNLKFDKAIRAFKHEPASLHDYNDKRKMQDTTTTTTTTTKMTSRDVNPRKPKSRSHKVISTTSAMNNESQLKIKKKPVKTKVSELKAINMYLGDESTVDASQISCDESGDSTFLQRLSSAAAKIKKDFPKRTSNIKHISMYDVTTGDFHDGTTTTTNLKRKQQQQIDTTKQHQQQFKNLSDESIDTTRSGRSKEKLLNRISEAEAEKMSLRKENEKLKQKVEYIIEATAAAEADRRKLHDKMIELQTHVQQKIKKAKEAESKCKAKEKILMQKTAETEADKQSLVKKMKKVEMLRKRDQKAMKRNMTILEDEKKKLSNKIMIIQEILEKRKTTAGENEMERTRKEKELLERLRAAGTEKHILAQEVKHAIQAEIKHKKKEEILIRKLEETELERESLMGQIQSMKELLEEKEMDVLKILQSRSEVEEEIETLLNKINVMEKERAKHNEIVGNLKRKLTKVFQVNENLVSEIEQLKKERDDFEREKQSINERLKTSERNLKEIMQQTQKYISSLRGEQQQQQQQQQQQDSEMKLPDMQRSSSISASDDENNINSSPTPPDNDNWGVGGSSESEDKLNDNTNNTSISSNSTRDDRDRDRDRGQSKRDDHHRIREIDKYSADDYLEMDNIIEQLDKKLNSKVMDKGSSSELPSTNNIVANDNRSAGPAGTAAISDDSMMPPVNNPTSLFKQNSNNNERERVVNGRAAQQYHQSSQNKKDDVVTTSILKESSYVTYGVVDDRHHHHQQFHQPMIRKNVSFSTKDQEHIEEYDYSYAASLEDDYYSDSESDYPNPFIKSSSDLSSEPNGNNDDLRNSHHGTTTSSDQGGGGGGSSSQQEKKRTRISSIKFVSKRISKIFPKGGQK